MMMKLRIFLSGLILLCVLACDQEEESIISPDPGNEPEVMPSITPRIVLSGLNRPWGMAFLNEDTWLITERNGALLLVENRSRQPLNHGLDVAYGGQGGLLDIQKGPNFEQSGFLYMTFSKRGPNNTSTLSLVRFRLTNGNIQDMEELFEAIPYYPNDAHFGSRIAFDEDGHLFVSLGDRYAYSTASNISDPMEAFPQDLGSHWGKIIRLNLDGSVPPDNPFINQTGALPEIYSYGHRNPQGIAFDLDNNQLFANEHGARGGDEINLIDAGNNYGWPVITYGRDYNGRSIGEGTSKAGMEQPLIYYDPSVAPSSHHIYTGDVYPDWKSQHFMTSLASQTLFRLNWDGNTMTEQEELYNNRLGRIRYITQSPDGYLYLLIDDDQGSVIKLATD